MRSRADYEVTTFDADVDHIDFGEEEESKSEDSLTHHDTDQIRITITAPKDTLAEATIDLAAVHSKSTVAKGSESADESIMARKMVVRFVQDSVAEAVDRQKRNADKNGRANVLLFNEGDLVLFSTVNLPRQIVTNVGSNKLLHKSSVHSCAAPPRQRIRLNRHVRCAHILRFTSVDLDRTISKGILPVKTALALEHLQYILVLTMLALSPRLKFGYLPAKPRYILTSFHQLVAERKLFPLIRKLGKGILYHVLLPI